MKSAIRLKLVNQSEDAADNKIVVFQKDIGDVKSPRPVAWKVFNKLSSGDQHSFLFPSDFQVRAKNGWGQPISKSVNVSKGQCYSVSKDSYGSEIKRGGTSTHHKTIEIKNELSKETILAELYKDGKLLAKKTHISPQKVANFRFRTSIWIGIVRHVSEGEIIPVDVLDAIQNEIHLKGILSADIIITGNEIRGYHFDLDNILFQD